MAATLVGVSLIAALSPYEDDLPTAASLLASLLSGGVMTVNDGTSDLGTSSFAVTSTAGGNLIVSEYDITLTGALPQTGGNITVLKSSAGFVQPIDGIDLSLVRALNSGEHVVGGPLVFGVRAMTQYEMDLTLELNP